MACAQEKLDKIVREFESHPRRDEILADRMVARRERELFLQLYDPAAIAECLKFKQQAENFVSRLEGPLRPLGGINLRSAAPIRTAGERREDLARILGRAFAEGTVFEKIDLPWGQIPYFGDDSSDRQIPKKIICTYYPDDTVPIFNTEHMEWFVKFLHLGAARDKLALERFSHSYGDSLTVGRKWEVLTKVMLAETKKHAVLSNEDSVYLMYCLYFSSACPPGFTPGGRG